MRVSACGDSSAYGAPKFAVVGFAQRLRYELKPRSISVACFCPGEVETPGLPQERKVLHPASAALKKIDGTMPLLTQKKRGASDARPASGMLSEASPWDVGRVFIIAVVIGCIYQIIVFRWFYPL